MVRILLVRWARAFIGYGGSRCNFKSFHILCTWGKILGWNGCAWTAWGGGVGWKGGFPITCQITTKIGFIWLCGCLCQLIIFILGTYNFFKWNLRKPDVHQWIGIWKKINSLKKLKLHLTWKFHAILNKNHGQTHPLMNAHSSRGLHFSTSASWRHGNS